MPVFFGLLALIVIAVVAVAMFSIWAIPFVALALIAAVTYLVLARRQDPTVGTVERGRRREPTGTPRKGRGGTETSNERVGQR